MIRLPLELKKLPELANQLELPQGTVYISHAASIADRLEMQFAFAGRDVAFIDLEVLPAKLDASLLILISPPSHCDDAFLSQAFACLQLAAPSLRQNSGWFITISIQDGQFGFHNSRQPLAAGLAGLSKTASHEWPEVRCRAIDVSADVNISSLLQEICADDDLIEVGLNKTQRCTPVIQAQDTDFLNELSYPCLKPNDVLLVSGGARGVTAQVCKALAVAYQPRLILLGRSHLADTLDDWPQDEKDIKQAVIQQARTQAKKILPRELTATVQLILNQRQMLKNMADMRQAGAQVEYFQVDMCDADAVAHMVQEVRQRWGNIQGVVHGAGVLADRLVEDKTAEQFQHVYDTKVQGLRSLLDATHSDSLKILVFFSSSTARFGRKGQIDYAVANEVMNKMAQQYQQRKRACRVLSVNWGPWDGGMVTPALKELFASEGIGVIDQQLGADYVVDALQHQGQTEVVVLGEREGMITESFDLSVASHPFLASHQLNGRAVLPAAMILEWFVAVASRASVYLKVCQVESFQVLKGVTLQANESMALTIQATGAAEQLQLEMSSTQGLHARAEVLLGSRQTQDSVIQLSNLNQLSGNPYEQQQLFHGKHFAVLHDVSLSIDGVSAQLQQKVQPCDWMKHCISNRWKTSPLAIDAAFQMAIIWCWQQYDMPSLPSSFANYQQFSAFPAHVELRLQVVSHQAHQMIADIEFLDRQSVLVAKIEGYVCTMSEGLKKVFLQG